MEIRIKQLHERYVTVVVDIDDEEAVSGLLNKDEAKEYRNAFRRADEELSEFIGDEG